MNLASKSHIERALVLVSWHIAYLCAWSNSQIFVNCYKSRPELLAPCVPGCPLQPCTRIDPRAFSATRSPSDAVDSGERLSISKRCLWVLVGPPMAGTCCWRVVAGCC
ncbi:hypothetical protein FA13DRAFT_1526665 [Coprinellus micaceus]|uniref:Uncharacterized protein n=1 Tax=Coprinellus micaceus TaxID=71717 RepID=A0A4Y7SJE0_COPMI|nr:hypothetical protein FA13DRAFT_1526665 [Coprinellus micaceus]